MAPQPFVLCPLLRVLFVFRRSNAGGRCILFAHVGTRFRISEILVASEMIDIGFCVGPDNGIARTMTFGFGLG